MKHVVYLAVLAAGLALSGCDDAPQNQESASYAQGPRPQMTLMADAPMARAAKSMSYQDGPRMEIGRNYAIEITEGSVSEALQADRDVCLQLGCVVTAVNTSDQFDAPSGSLNAFVPQANAAKFHDHLVGAPNRVVTSFNETAQNREDNYQDVKVRLERLEYMRKRLYGLADQKSDKVADLLQVERELMRVETDIERLTQDRKGIEKVTDNVSFFISYAEQPPKAGDVNFAPLKGLFSDMANTFIAAVRYTAVWLARWLPAALLIGLVVLGLRRRFR